MKTALYSLGGPGSFSNKPGFVIFGLIILLLVGSHAHTSRAAVALAVTNTTDSVHVSWTSSSVTVQAPFLHYEFQVQTSTNLGTWSNFGAIISGGTRASAGIPLNVSLGRTNTMLFARVTYRFNMPGANLSSLNFTGADLRHANLAGANLTGANFTDADLSGANLSGATLTGAILAGANLNGVNLNGLDLAGLDLSTTLGTPTLSQITANPTGNAALFVPHLAYNSGHTDLVANDPLIPGAVSTRNAMILLKTNATVGQLNALLATHGASIVASSPGDATLPNAVLMARFPTTNAQHLFDLTVTLNSNVIVDAAAPDLQITADYITEDVGSAPGWSWEIAGVASGGNWGLEYARVPQMWNVLPRLKQQGTARVPTCVIDNYFANGHEDLIFNSLLGPAAPVVDDHGMHVAGIIGATPGNLRGLDGVNPLASLTGYTMVTQSNDFKPSNSLLDLFEPDRQASAFRMVEDVRNVLRQAPTTKIINMSMGYNWYLLTNQVRPTISSPFTPSQLASIEFLAKKYGAMMAAVAYMAPRVLITCSAGNSSNLTPARFNSPMATAALEFAVPNIMVVGAHDIAGDMSSFSNLGGHVAAPGEDILSASAAGPASYTNYPGTSMAAPFVAGVAGFMLAVDNTLTPPELINLLRRNGQNVDAFTSLMEIDTLPGRDHKVLRLLFDIDDSSEDGSLRVEVPAPVLGQDRTFGAVTGTDYTDLDLVSGDGVVDMSDFRRWRDWLLFGQGNEDLNGSTAHLKFDANGDLDVDRSRELTHHPRGDFNGDGRLDTGGLHPVPGTFFDVPLSDLTMLADGKAWDDTGYTNPAVLYDLIDSVDLNVSAANFFFKHSDIVTETAVGIHDAASGLPFHFGTRTYSPNSPEHILTVPVGTRLLVASAPISIGDGTNVQMRSIGEKQFTLSQRGGDFAVDLALWEMTAVAETLNPALRVIISEPNTNQADAYIGAETSGSDTNISYGARGWANEEATLYAIANAGQLPQPPTNLNEVTTFTSAVRWERSFIKDTDQSDPRFVLKPMLLRLAGSAPGSHELRATAEAVVEMRSFDISANWKPVFRFQAEIAGNQGVNGNESTFDVVVENGDLPPAALQKNGEFGAEYRQVRKRDKIDLDGIPNGHSFELRLRLNTLVFGPKDEGEALARLGDPLDYGSGFRMEYGGFGELPRIKRVTSSAPSLNLQAGLIPFAPASAQTVIEYFSKTNFYYRLYRGADGDLTSAPFAMKLGFDGDDSTIDPAPLLPNPTPDDYVLENQPLDQPLDLDGDGIDDVYELLRPAILDPLSAADAFLDPDGDGRSNLVEYQDGTNPQVPDSPATHPTLNFPGLLVPSYPGGKLIDLNNDGLLDSASPALNIALAHLGGTFDELISSPLTGIRAHADTAYLRLDNDAFPDAVVIDILTNRVFTYRGVGNGTFTPLTNYAGLNNPSLIALCNVNGDALMDIAVFSENGRGVDLHVNNGDGTLTRTATVTTNAYGIGSSFTMADLNNDSRDDIIVGYAFNAVVFLTQPNGTYGPAQQNPVGSFPEAIAAGDLNHDGRLDLVVANASSDDLSVLIASAPGTFQTQVRYPVGDNPRVLRLADLNGDTHLDAIISLASADYQIVLPGLGNGAFGSLFTVPTGSFLVDIRDWNSDGKLDLVSTLPSRGGLVNFGLGDGTFDTRLQIVPTNNPPTQVTAVDFNGDSKLELVGLQTQRNSIDVWEHAAVAGTNRLLASFAVGPWVTAYASGDFNGDGLVDLALTTKTNSFNPRGTNQVTVLTNAGNFVFQDAGRYSLTSQPTLIVTGDFNGNGAMDLAVHLGGGTLNGGSQLVSLIGNGAGGFTPGTPTSVGTVVSSLTAVNADNDVRTEVLVNGSRLVGSSFVEFLEVFAFNGASGWTNRQTLTPTNTVYSLQTASINGDAYPDLVVTENESITGINSLRMFPGGPGGFGAEQVLARPVDFSSFTRLADLNGDGLLDVVSGYSLYLAKSDGGFHPPQEVWIGAEGVHGVADFNRDGKADLLGGLSVLLQK